MQSIPLYQGWVMQENALTFQGNASHISKYASQVPLLWVLFPLKFTFCLDKATYAHTGFNFKDPELEILSSLDIIH